jgi:hypothetical protein
MGGATRLGRGHRPVRRAADQHELVSRARQEDIAHRERFGRPISADNLRSTLHISAASARDLVKFIRAEQPSLIVARSAVAEPTMHRGLVLVDAAEQSVEDDGDAADGST